MSAFNRAPLPREIVVPRKGGDRAKVTARFTLRMPKGVEIDCVRVRHLTMNEVEHLEVSEFNRLFRPEGEVT